MARLILQLLRTFIPNSNPTQKLVNFPLSSTLSMQHSSAEVALSHSGLSNHNTASINVYSSWSSPWFFKLLFSYSYKTTLKEKKKRFNFDILLVQSFLLCQLIKNHSRYDFQNNCYKKSTILPNITIHDWMT